MLRSCKGYYLTEVVASFSILLVLLGFLLPNLIFILNEKEMLYKKRIALQLLDEQFDVWRVNGQTVYDKPLFYHDYSYSLTLNPIHNDSNYVKGCISWEAQKGENDEWCKYAKR